MKKPAIKIIRFLGFLIFLAGLLFVIAFFFTSIEKGISTSDRISRIIGIVIFGVFVFLGFRLLRFRKKQEKDNDIPIHEKSISQSQIKPSMITSPKENISVGSVLAYQANSSTPLVREERKQKNQNFPGKPDYKPLLELCAEIENDTENDYIPFDAEIPVEIIYQDNEGEITNRAVDVRYIAKSDYDNNYYFKGYCHLRNEDRAFKVERIQKTIVNGNSVDFIQHIVDTYRNTEKYKETIISNKTKKLLNSDDTIGYTARILTYIARIDGIFTRKEKTVIAAYLKELDNNQNDIEIENYIAELVEIDPSTAEYKRIIKNADISVSLLEKAKEITGKDPLRNGAFEILNKQYETTKKSSS